jgi:hypothetical protein
MDGMEIAIVVFTRDLRLHDNPALAAACAQARQVVPVFVADEKLTDVSPNRASFLRESLADLREVHTPWQLPASQRRPLAYPPPISDPL